MKSLAFYLSINARNDRDPENGNPDAGGPMVPSICFCCDRYIRANDPVVETSEGPLHADCYDEMQTTAYDYEEA